MTSFTVSQLLFEYLNGFCFQCLQETGELWNGRPYVCKYGVNDPQSGNVYSTDVKSDGTTVNGEYRTLMADGRTQVVTYTADWKNGYRALVNYI